VQIEAPKKKSKPGKSVYAKATDTGIDPETAAKRLNLDWDSAADIDGEEEDDDETEVPSAVVSLSLTYSNKFCCTHGAIMGKTSIWKNFQLNAHTLMFLYHLF